MAARDSPVRNYRFTLRLTVPDSYDAMRGGSVPFPDDLLRTLPDEACRIVASLGGVESLVTQPITPIHHGMFPEERARRGNVDGMVRVSCGLEDIEDLIIPDLEQALRGADGGGTSS